MFKNIINYVLRFLDRNGLIKRKYVTVHNGGTIDTARNIVEDIFMAVTHRPKTLSFKECRLTQHQIELFNNAGFGTHVDMLDEILLKFDSRSPYTSVLEVMLKYVKLEHASDVVSLKARAKRFDDAVNDLGYPYFEKPAFATYPGGLAYFDKWFIDRSPCTFHQ